ncbi:MAG: c-type cytochrome [Myxococcota bacterium]
MPAAGEIPRGNLRGDPIRGAALYAQYCTTCHGEKGHGDGPAAAAMKPPPADHTDPARMGALADADLYEVIQKGGVAVGKSPLMAAWGALLDDSQIRDLIAFVRQLSGT